MPTFLSLTGGQIEYATRTKIQTLGTEIASTYSLLKVKAKIRQSAKLLRYLRVLQADISLSTEERTAIYQALIKIGELYHIPTAPTVTATRVVNILVGAQGPVGPAGAQGIAGAGFPTFADASVTIDDTIDYFPIGECNGCRWDYYCIGIGAGRRAGSIVATWDNSTVVFSEYQTDDLGGTTDDIVFDVDISGGQVRLNVTITAHDWEIRGTRYQMQDLIV